MAQKTVKIIDKLGIHARPATVLVSETNKFESNAKIVFGGKEGNLKSMMGIMALGIKCDDEVEIVFEGSDASEALSSVIAVMEKEGLI